MVDVLAEVVALAGQSDWALARPVPVVTLEIRKVVGLGILVPAGTLFLLYLFRPRPYVLAGASAWVTASVMLLILSFDIGATGVPNSPDYIVSGRVATFIWAIAALTFSASLRFSSLWFRAPLAASQQFLWGAGLMALWVIIAATFLRPAAVLGPTFVVMCAWQLRAAWVYSQVARQYRFLGALLAAAGVLGIVTVNIIGAAVAISQGGFSQATTNVAFFNLLSVGLVVLGMHLLIFEDIIDELRKVGDDLRHSRDEMVSLAVTDPLTGCYNRRFLAEIETHELHQHRRYGLPLSLLYIDIDHFKAINDTRGHEMGDKVLKTIGNILRTQTRLADYVLRWGGDEFLVLLSTDEANARIKAQSIRQAFLESAVARNLPDRVDLSIGCVFVPPDTEDLLPLIAQADRDMYRHRRGMVS